MFLETYPGRKLCQSRLDALLLHNDALDMAMKETHVANKCKDELLLSVLACSAGDGGFPGLFQSSSKTHFFLVHHRAQKKKRIFQGPAFFWLVGWSSWAEQHLVKTSHSRPVV